MKHLMHHSGDPLPSQMAAEKMTNSAKHEKHSRIVYELVEATPDSTAIELLASQDGLTEYQIRRRLTDLKQSGAVATGFFRKCKVRGTDMLTWRVCGPFSLQPKFDTSPTYRTILASVIAGGKALGRKLPKGSPARQALYEILKAASDGREADLGKVNEILDTA